MVRVTCDENEKQSTDLDVKILSPRERITRSKTSSELSLINFGKIDLKIDLNLKTISLMPIGIMRVNKKTFFKFSNYFTGIFYVAPHFGMQAILFSPNDVNFDSNTVKGTILENGHAKTITTEIPYIIDNSILDSTYDEFIAKMESRSYMIRQRLNTSKIKTYNMLLKEGKYKRILIPTVPLSSFEDIIKKLEENNEGRSYARLNRAVRNFEFA